MVYEAREVGTDAEAGELLQRDPEAVFTRVLLPTDQGRLPRAPAEQAEGRAEVSPIEYSPQRSAWRVRTNRAGYIFTGDAYYPGWKAQLDGRPTTLYRANIAFRAVHVPAGEHVIVHEFEPFSVRIGLAIAALSLILVGSLLIAARPRQSGSAPASEKG